MEDDAVLHPSLTPSKARRAMEDSINLVNQRGSMVAGILYLGICLRYDIPSHCVGGISSTTQLDINVGFKCFGCCTHAFAITKKTASLFLNELYDYNFLSRQDGLSQIDQALLYFVRRQQEVNKNLISMVVGINLESPESKPLFGSHNGLMYQCNRTQSTMQLGTSLSSDVFRPLPCYSMILSESTMAKGLFQVATLVGACVRAGTHPKFCASLVSVKSNSAALQSFMTSALSLSPTAKCTLKATKEKEDSELVQTLFTNSSFLDISSSLESHWKAPSKI